MSSKISKIVRAYPSKMRKDEDGNLVIHTLAPSVREWRREHRRLKAIERKKQQQK